MYDDIEHISRTFHRYRLYYKLGDFVMLFLIIYALSYYFNTALLFSGYVEYYVIDTISLDRFLVAGLSMLVSALIVLVLYLRKTSVDPIGMVESRYEWMRERLSTAWDTRDEDNVVAADLRVQVTSQLARVDAGSFLDRKHLAVRLAVSLVVASLLIGLAATDTHSGITPEDITRTVDELSGEHPPGAQTPEDAEKTSQNGELDEELYGETSVASIEGESVEVVIVPGLGTAVTIRHAAEEDDVRFVPSQTYPVDIVASSAADESYQTLQQMSSPDRDLIMEYALLRSKL